MAIGAFNFQQVINRTQNNQALSNNQDLLFCIAQLFGWEKVRWWPLSFCCASVVVWVCEALNLGRDQSQCVNEWIFKRIKRILHIICQSWFSGKWGSKHSQLIFYTVLRFPLEYINRKDKHFLYLSTIGKDGYNQLRPQDVVPWLRCDRNRPTSPGGWKGLVPSHSPPNKNQHFVMMDFEKTPEKTMVKTIFPIEECRKKLEGPGGVAIHKIDPPQKIWHEKSSHDVLSDLMKFQDYRLPWPPSTRLLRNVKRGDTLVILIYGLMNPGAEIDGYKCQGANEIVPKTLDYNSVELTSLTTASAIERCRVKAIFFLLLALQVSSVAATRKFCRSPKFPTILAKKKTLSIFFDFHIAWFSM